MRPTVPEPWDIRGGSHRRDLTHEGESVNNVLTLVATFGSTVHGAALGGVLARQVGVTAPFWFGFVGSLVFVLLL